MAFDYTYLPESLLNGLTLGAIYALVAVGLTLIFGIMDIVNFAHGEFLMVGAYTTVVATAQLGIGFFPALGLAILVTGIVGILSERLVFRPLKDRDLVELFLASIGLIFVLQVAAIVIFGQSSVGLEVPFGLEVFSFAGIRLPKYRVLMAVISLVTFGGMWVFLQRTKTGKAMRAVSMNEAAAKIRGINTNYVYLATFGIGAGLAGLAGGLVGGLYTIQPSMGVILVLKAFAAVILGGLGSVPGALIGGLLIGVVESVGSSFGPSAYRHGYAFAILILILLVRPQGIMGGWQR